MDDGHRLAELPVLRADLGDRGGYGVRSGEWSARSLRKYRSRIWWRRWLRVSWLAPGRGNADQYYSRGFPPRGRSTAQRDVGALGVVTLRHRLPGRGLLPGTGYG